MEIPERYKKAVGRCEPIETDGLTLYPIEMEEYEEFTSARPAIEVMQQTFPAKYAVMPLLSAFYAMDFDAIMDGQPPIGWLQHALLFFALALRLGRGEEPQERLRHFKLEIEPDDQRKLKRVVFSGKDGNEHSITPILFSKLRPVLAAQNGIELVSESENPELIEAERDLAAAKAPHLKLDIYDAVATVSLWSHCDETEINGWPILKFERRRRALQRSLDYTICAINEGAGCTYKGGNPVPSLFFDREKMDSSALMPLSNFAGGQGEKAVYQQMATGAQNAPPPEFQIQGVK